MCHIHKWLSTELIESRAAECLSILNLILRDLIYSEHVGVCSNVDQCLVDLLGLGMQRA